MLLWAIVSAVALWVLWCIVRRSWRRTLNADEAVLVTGCDIGFGYAIVQALHQWTAASIYAGCVTEEGRRRLAVLGTRVTALQLDVTESAEVTAAFEMISGSGQSLRGVVNNAGIGCYGWCEELALERFERNIRVNLLGVIHVTKCALPLLRLSRGRLVTMGSMGGRMPSAFGSAYLPTKAAVASFQDCVRQEVYQFGIRCSLVEPGFFATGMLHRSAAIGEDDSVPSAETVVRGYEPFANRMKRTEGSVLLSERINGGEAGIVRVTDAVLDALTTVYPRTQYLVGVDANGPLIPSWIVDFAQAYLI